VGRRTCQLNFKTINVVLAEILGITWKDVLNPQFYIDHGGLWMILFIVFAETGLFAGFFLPGDALLFVTGIFSDKIVEAALFKTGTQWADLFILWTLIAIAGILGNYVGYWFGRKSGPFLYQRKDTFSQSHFSLHKFCIEAARRFFQFLQ